MKHTLKNSFFLLFFCCIFCVEKTNAQNQDLSLVDSIEASKVILIANSIDTGGVYISWLIDSLTWFEQGRTAGYSLQRTDSLGKKEILANAIMPKDSNWFKKPEADPARNYYGIMYVFANAPDYTKEVLHNVLREAEASPELAVGLGLGFYDKTGILGMRYEYELILNSTGETLGGIGSFYSYFNQERNPQTGINYQIGEETPLVSFRPEVSFQVDFIPIRAKAFGDSIVVRWAPNNASLWLRAVEEGYILKRTEKIIEDGEEKYLTREIDGLKPPPLEKLNNPSVLADTAALLATQALYGEQMTISGKDGFYQQMSELDLRFMVALQSADKSKLAADLLALRFVDKEVEIGKNYTYSVSIPSKEGKMTEDIFDIKNEKLVEPELPIGFEATQREHAVFLTWDYGNSNFYTTYTIERSDDNGATFKMLTPEPLLFIIPDGATEYIYEFADSVEQNYKPYIYRLRGKDAFANWSDPAELTAMAVDLTPPPAPQIILGESSPEGIVLNWDFDSIPPSDLEGFDIFIGPDSDNVSQKLTKKSLPANARTYRHEAEIQTNSAHYFRVVARDTSGNRASSLSQYVHVIDSIPPVAPTSLAGHIDSMGVVTLTWAQNEEADLEGYRIYVANNLEDEFAQLTDTLLNINLFFDTVALNTLNRALYFKVAAEDLSRNTSEYSEILKLLKPDTIRPVSPVLHNTKGSGNGVELTWISSTSKDVEQQILYRKLQEDTLGNWEAIQEFSAKTELYFDESTRTEQYYIYTMEAVDSSGNRSDQAFPVIGRRFFDGDEGEIVTLNATKNEDGKSVSIFWESEDSGDDFLENQQRVYFLYRSKNGGKYSKIKQLRSTQTNFTDEPGVGKYSYGVRMVYEDGKMGVISKTEPIEFAAPESSGGK